MKDVCTAARNRYFCTHLLICPPQVPSEKHSRQRCRSEFRGENWSKAALSASLILMWKELTLFKLAVLTGWILTGSTSIVQTQFTCELRVCPQLKSSQRKVVLCLKGWQSGRRNIGPSDISLLDGDASTTRKRALDRVQTRYHRPSMFKFLALPNNVTLIILEGII